MTLPWLKQAHEGLLGQGWAVTSSTEAGLDHVAVREALSPALAPDRGWAMKLHARDVVTYHRGTGQVTEADSNAHEGVTYPRFRMMDSPPARRAAAEILCMVPPPLRRQTGRVAVDYFRYKPGIECGPHRDEFGDLIAIWVLGRDGDGGENFLLTGAHEDVFRRALAPGEMLIFRDELFLHGVTPMDGEQAWRDALIFTSLRAGQ